MPKGVYQRTEERRKTDSDRCIAWNKARIGKKRNPEAVARGAQKRRKYSCNDSYFEVINTPEKAYWLGFIAADGCVMSRGNVIKLLVIILNEKDKTHLERFKKAINSNHKLYQQKNRNQYGISINSPKMFDDLVNNGIVPRKSKILRYPPTIPDEYNKDFIRGYFDGDGCFSIHENLPRFSLYSGSKPMLQSVLSILDDDLSFSFPYKVTLNRRNYAIDIGAKKNVMKIYDYFYNNRCLYLIRKRNKIKNYEEVSSKC